MNPLFRFILFLIIGIVLYSVAWKISGHNDSILTLMVAANFLGYVEGRLSK